jgi:RNA polymerase sigma-70 factor (ECF subfamily)
MEIEKLVRRSKKGDISAFMELLREKESHIYEISFAYT